MTTIRMTASTHRGGATAVRFRYDRELVELLKRTVPSYARTWDPDAKVWTLTVRADACAFARKASKLGRHTIVSDFDWDPKPKRPAASPCRHGDWATELLRAVGPTRGKAVFRALTSVLHPDRPDTGDRGLFERLDAARREASR